MEHPTLFLGIPKIFHELGALCEDLVAPNVGVQVVDQDAGLGRHFGHAEEPFLEAIQQRDGLPPPEVFGDLPHNVAHLLVVVVGDVLEGGRLLPYGADQVEDGVQYVSLPHLAPPVPVEVHVAPELGPFHALRDGAVPLAAGRRLAGPLGLADRVDAQLDAVVADAVLVDRHAGDEDLRHGVAAVPVVLEDLLDVPVLEAAGEEAEVLVALLVGWVQVLEEGLHFLGGEGDVDGILGQGDPLFGLAKHVRQGLEGGDDHVVAAAHVQEGLSRGVELVELEAGLSRRDYDDRGSVRLELKFLLPRTQEVLVVLDGSGVGPRRHVQTRRRRDRRGRRRRQRQGTGMADVPGRSKGQRGGVSSDQTQQGDDSGGNERRCHEVLMCFRTVCVGFLAEGQWI